MAGEPPLHFEDFRRVLWGVLLSGVCALWHLAPNSLIFKGRSEAGFCCSFLLSFPYLSSLNHLFQGQLDIWVDSLPSTDIERILLFREVRTGRSVAGG